ncbi:MAG TPA: glycosyltransferase 87 family protein [Herpetosiphonaceae bacterium]
MALVLDIAGAKHVYTLPSVAAAALAALAIVWLVPASTRGAVLAPHSVPQHWLALLPIAGFVPAVLDVAAFVPQDGGWTPERFVLLIGGVIALLALNRTSAGWIAVAALVLGVIVRLIHMEHLDIRPENGDMLPLVLGAIDNLLAGRSPYRLYHMPWDVPLTYFPITWLSYLPAYLLGIDLRWTNIAAEIGIAGALLCLSARRGGWHAAWRHEPTLFLWAWLFVQPSVIHWDTGNTAPITWLLLAVTLALVLAQRERAAALALGVTAAGTPLVTVFGVFIALYWLRRYGWQQTLRLLALSAVVAGALILPFLLWSPQDFVMGTYDWFNAIEGWPRQKWNETDPHIWSVITGFSGEFWSRGTEGWLKPIQAVIVGVIAVVYWRRGAQASALNGHATAAYLGFMLFNPVLWPYLYNPALIVSLVGIAAATALYGTSELRVPARRQRSQPTFL